MKFFAIKDETLKVYLKIVMGEGDLRIRPYLLGQHTGHLELCEWAFANDQRNTLLQLSGNQVDVGSYPISMGNE